MSAAERDALPRLAYSTAEVALMLGCTRQHVFNMVKAGELRAAKFGHKVLVPAAELARLLGESR